MHFLLQKEFLKDYDIFAEISSKTFAFRMIIFNGIDLFYTFSVDFEIKKLKWIMNVDNSKVIIVGGGAAGLSAAGFLRENGIPTVIIESENRIGKKLAITGKGRCNVTNNCDLSTLISNVQTNPRFLYTAFSFFSSSDTMALFERLGVRLKTERGNRVFPESDRAADIVNALKRYAGNCVMTDCKAVEVITEKNDDKAFVSGVKIRHKNEEQILYSDNIILCTGGKSYPLTGSKGDGYRIAERVGHSITQIRPSLVPLETCEKWCAALQGLSLKNVSVKVTDEYCGSDIVYEDFGEMLFTHFGISGPMVLSASAHLKNIEDGRYKFHIDLKPALDEKTLDARILSDFSKYSNKNFCNALNDLLPQKLIPIIIELSGILPDKKVNTVTKAERRKIIEILKNMIVTVRKTRPIEEAVITSGGISVNEIFPRTMESKIVSGLYFAGEIIDVDAYTGGFNLQIAFSTAMCAANGILKKMMS